MRYSNVNFRKVSTALFQITGLSYYFLSFAEINLGNNSEWNKLQEYQKRLQLLRELIAKGETYKHFLVDFSGKQYPENYSFGYNKK